MESTFPFLASQSSSPAAFPASCWGFLLPFPHSGHFLPDRGTWTWAGECGYGTAAAAPRTLHSLKLTPTPGPKDHSTDLTYWMNLEGFQVTMERAIQLNISCECGGVAESLRAVVCVCVCVRMCREKASLLVYGSAPWELRWGVAVKDSTPPPTSWFPSLGVGQFPSHSSLCSKPMSFCPRCSEEPPHQPLLQKHHR